MMKLLLPYALDENGKLVYIKDAQKGVKYTCPICSAELLLRISKIPEWQKYYKRNHFAHKYNLDNHCSESFLHKLFKDRCVDFIKKKIRDEQNLSFVWQCSRCKQTQTEKLLNNIAEVVSEFDFGVCKPDIALIDSNGKVVTVVEIVVSHKPTPNALRYYKENKIKCLQIRVECFDECEDIKNIFTQADKITLYPNQICEKCSSTNSKSNNESQFKSNTSQSNLFGIDKEKLIHILKTKGDKICRKCGRVMLIQETWNGEPVLRCENYPGCDYTQRIDSILWPNSF